MLQLDRRFESEVFLPQPVESVFDFFANAHNLERITPPFLNFHIVSQSTPQIQEGTILEYKLKLRGLPMRWRSQISVWEKNRRFVDVQLKGPYAKWIHLHEFLPHKGGTLMRDQVDYRLPLGFLGRLLAGPIVDRDVKNIFSYREQVIRKIYQDSPANA